MTINEFHDFELAGWEKASTEYDRRFGELTSQSIPPLLDAGGAAPGTRLLDVACGPGYVAAAAARRGATVIGIDFSGAMVDLATRVYPELEFQEGDAEGLGFTSQSFDSVVMNFGMLHLARPEAAIAEAFRVLRPGGKYAFTVWDTPSRAVGFGIILESVQLHGNVNVPLPEGPPFFRFSDPEEAIRSMHAAGFTDVRVEQVPLVWQLPSAGALFDAFANGAVRTAALLRAQTEDALADIHTAIMDEAAKYRQGEIIELPMAAVLTSGRRPVPGV